MKILISKLLNFIIRNLGYKIFINDNFNNSNYKFVVQNHKNIINGLNLNIGAGEYQINGFKSLDYYTDYYFKEKINFKSEYIQYDIRNDKIPYNSNTVDNIYVSHVIEHIEYEYVEKFISEAFRVLKKNGTLRISCPDGKFLYNVSQFENEYWNWRYKNFKDLSRYNTDWSKIENFDFLLRELSTPKGKFYKYKNKNYIRDFRELKKLKFNEIKKMLSNDLYFRESFPGDHISIWDFETLKKIGITNGFSFVVESKYRGSISKVMQGPEFDLTYPQMSLYVDFKK